MVILIDGFTMIQLTSLLLVLSFKIVIHHVKIRYLSPTETKSWFRVYFIVFYCSDAILWISISFCG